MQARAKRGCEARAERGTRRGRPATLVAVASTTVTGMLDKRFDISSPDLDSLVQRWLHGAEPNFGLLMRAPSAEENGSDNRKVFCGKGFPLETSTGLSLPEAESHRPFVRIEYTLP